MFIRDIDQDISMRMLAAFDAERLFKMTDESREYLRKWLPWVDDTVTVDDSLQFIKNAFQLHAEQKSLTAGIFYKEELVGVAGFNHFDWRNQIGFIGYWLSAPYQGHGIMTRVVSELTDYAFTELKLNRLEIRAAKDNIRSQAIPKRLGYEKEGLLRQAELLYGTYVDHVVYGMISENWNPKE